MIKSRNMTLICCTFLALAILFTYLFMTDKLTFLSQYSSASDSLYSEKIFDKFYVHSLNIEVDSGDWQNMVDNANNKEYISCNVTIDGETLKNVGIRAKGNTSLSNVQSMDSDRYSFKLEFDQYDDINYHGLDKLALNNIIQDNTFMKDYFSYVMINEIDADSPLCSYIYIKVNNEDWGLYLGVEAIEEAFAKRNYGADFGQIYKPESMAIGGNKNKNGSNQMDRPDGGFPEGMPEGFTDGEMPNMPDNQMPNGEMSTVPDATMTDETISENNKQAQRMSGGDFGDGFGGMGGNSSVALQYIDDEIDSYSAMFDYAAFNPDLADKKRLISSIKQLNNGENLDKIVNINEVLRYFVAHNFVVNFDSYTGNMMHNYYLYEKDGMLSMIAWDYNLAFGSFGGGMGGFGGNRGNQSSETKSITVDNATQMVNYPIDTPVSDATLEDRPMIGKLFVFEEYMNTYHELFDEFISSYFESGEFEKEHKRVFNMISEYVLKDPTKFCTMDEFITGADTLKQFCMLRSASVRGQLSETIPATTTAQSEDSSTLIDASYININDMGSMGHGGGMGQEMENRNNPSGKTENTAQAENANTTQNDSAIANENGYVIPNDETNNVSDTPAIVNGENNIPNHDNRVNQARGNLQHSPIGGGGMQNTKSFSDYYIEYRLLLGCLIIIILGLVFAKTFKRRR